MKILHEFERRLEGLVEGFFATTFRGSLQPVELGRRVLREMEAGRTLGVKEVWAPNHYRFLLSPDDRERLRNAERALGIELRQLIREGARERGWSLVGPPQVEFVTDESLGRGRFRCEASLVEGAEPAPDEGLQGILFLIEEGTAVREFPLERDVVTLGRHSGCDVVIPDPGVSRRHAQIRRDGVAHVITDLGSTNGTIVNEAPVTERVLEDGDRITIGNTVLEFRRG